MSNNSSPFPSCFRPPTSDDHRLPPSPPPNSGNRSLATCLYQTQIGLFTLTWSTSFLGHSLHLQLHHDSSSAASSPLSLSTNLSLPTTSFHLQIKPFNFWKKQGSKKLYFNAHEETTTPSKIHLYWNLSKAKYGSGPEPKSGFFIAAVVDREMVLVVGDLIKEAFSKTKALKPERLTQAMVLRREHVIGNKVYKTEAKFGGKNREILIDCNVGSDARLCFSVDNKRVLLIKRLKWKFRGNERIEVDGVPIQVSWDVYNWLFENMNCSNNHGHAVFLFKFESADVEEMNDDEEVKNDGVSWKDSCGLATEWRMKNKLTRKARSSSSSSMSWSSAASSSGCSSSVMEWTSVEESKLIGPRGFSLLVYAWKK